MTKEWWAELHITGGHCAPLIRSTINRRGPQKTNVHVKRYEQMFLWNVRKMGHKKEYYNFNLTIFGLKFWTKKNWDRYHLCHSYERDPEEKTKK